VKTIRLLISTGTELDCRHGRVAVLAIATSWHSACVTGGSEPAVAVCPPVVESSEAFQTRAADELGLLPCRPAIVEMLGNDAVLREQVMACGPERGRR